MWIKHIILTVEGLQNCEIISLTVKLSKHPKCTSLYNKRAGSANVKNRKQRGKVEDKHIAEAEIQMELQWVSAGLVSF